MTEKLSEEEIEKEAVFVFLDRLRDSGETNMFGAGSYIRSNFKNMTEEKSRKLLIQWMDSFSERHPKE